MAKVIWKVRGREEEVDPRNILSWQRSCHTEFDAFVGGTRVCIDFDCRRSLIRQLNDPDGRILSFTIFEPQGEEGMEWLRCQVPRSERKLMLMAAPGNISGRFYSEGFPLAGKGFFEHLHGGNAWEELEDLIERLASGVSMD